MILSNAISLAYGNNRIAGYPDGTFKPDKNVSRAETAKMLNSLFERRADKDSFKDIMVQMDLYEDIKESHWAYYDIIEASISHEYQRREKDSYVENWLRLIIE